MHYWSTPSQHQAAYACITPSPHCHHTYICHANNHETTPSALKNSLTTPHPHSTTPSQHHTLTTPQPHNITTSQPHNITPSQHHTLTTHTLTTPHPHNPHPHNTTPSQHHTLTTPHPHNTTPAQYPMECRCCACVAHVSLSFRRWFLRSPPGRNSITSITCAQHKDNLWWSTHQLLFIAT